MPRSTAPATTLARTAVVLFALSALLYVLGAAEIHLHACGSIGPSIAMAAVALGIGGAALLATYTIVVRTAASWFTLAGVALLLLAMYLAVGAMASPGCSMA